MVASERFLATRAASWSIGPLVPARRSIFLRRAAILCATLAVAKLLRFDVQDAGRKLTVNTQPEERMGSGAVRQRWTTSA